jgi:hypothetical protein
LFGIFGGIINELNPSTGAQLNSFAAPAVPVE